jgi:hypothetical protein
MRESKLSLMKGRTAMATPDQDGVGMPRLLMSAVSLFEAHEILNQVRELLGVIRPAILPA